MRRPFLSIFLIFLFSASCTQKVSILKPAKLVRSESKGLSEKIAKERKKALSNLNYHFEIDLENVKKSENYTGSSTVSFDFNPNELSSDYLSLDFEGGEVLNLIVNKKKAAFRYNNFYINLEKKLFIKGKNTVQVSFSHDYSKTGSGLYKFKDPSDNKVYVYTDFEPFDANQFAPLFDQPNLKASYSLDVKAPKSWTVITSIREQMVSGKSSYKLWSFPKSQKFSTYIFSLHGGPYKVWSDKVKLKSKKIELRLFARKSLSKFVKPDFWFKATKQGFNFFEQYFSTEYPYTKYDQVLVPDFNSGAMENVAAVTFNEGYVSREKKAPRAQRRALVGVIFHEMAHMWFGNLVTMNWWNDLWLNESFATFMASTGLYYNTKYTEIWTVFNSRRKQGAYKEDRWRTTHPIETDIPSTSEATASFDGITYGKGAAALKQLVFLIGEENFKKGLADYFKSFAEKNTLRKNFIDSLQSYTDENLNSWTKEWLQTKGLNAIESKVNCNDSRLSSVDFKQSIISGESVFRTHKLKLALWLSSNPESPDLTEEIKVSGKNTNWTPKKEMPCPKAVFPNWEDHAFIQVQLDEKSFEYFKQNIDRIDSDLMKAQFWSVVRTMFVLGKIAPEKILPLVTKHLSNEVQADSLTTILSLTHYKESLFYYYSNKKQAKKDQAQLSNALKSKIVNVESVDAKKTLFNSWLFHTYNIKPEELNLCLKSNCNFKIGFELDLDRKWLIALYLGSIKNKNTKPHLNALSKKDKSRRGELYKARVEASLTAKKNKDKLLKKALDPKNEFSLKMRVSILSGLIPNSQKSAHYDFIHNAFYEHIEKISELPVRVQKTFANRFQPLFCGDFKEQTLLTEKKINDSDWDFSVKKSLLQALDSEERCLKIKDLSRNSGA